MSARNSVQPAALDSSLVMEASRQSLPRCISKTQEEAALSHRNSPSPSHRASRAPQLTDMPEPISRAVSMFNTYPLMQVAGTAYQNAFNCASRRRYSSESIMESSQLMTDAREESLRLEDSTTEMRTATSDANMVRLSTAIKRAAMWQTILVTALAQSRVAQDYRTRRLRSVLERLLLPVVLMRRELTGSIISTNAMAKRRMSSFPAKISAGSAESDPNGGYIKSHYHLFDSFGSSLLMQHLAESMVRQRYLPGEIIIRAGEPMQQAMYFIVSGKVEARREFQEHGATRIDKSVVSSGEFFGGILRTTCMFDSTYKTISQCIVWVLAARDFQRIFKNFADDTMRNMFVEELRRYCHEKRLLELYPMAPPLLYQVPVYRKLNHDLQAYVEQFEPIVKVRGEPLFCQGDAPGDVYVLVEGVVERSVKGPDNRYASGVSQLIAPVACSMANRYRYVLLGEEPHILPGTQKYRCIVHSRTALFYRISGDHFVNALLDDAKFYVLLRERLTALIRTQMKLDPSCLAFAPLFRDFPTASLAAIAQAAEPRVVWRSLSLCEPGQHIKDVFLVIAGDVRDTRNFGHRPTGRLPTPPPACDSSSDDDDSPRGHRLGFGGSSKRGKKREKRVGFLPGRAAGKLAISTGAGGSATAMGKNGSKKAQPTGNVSRDELPEEPNGYDWFFSDSEEDEDDQESPPEAGRGLATTTSMSIAARTTVGSMGMHTATHITFPEELHELNPALPIQPAKRFVFTCGGGWEGLLVEKWPHGWEATTTTEVWAIPTLKMRTEYASFPKSTQSAILHAARLQQKESLGLASIIVARIPPLSAYMPRDRSLAVAAAADASKSGKDGKRATSAKSGRRGGSRSKRVADGRSNSNSASRLQRQSVDSNNGGSIFGMRPQHSDSLVSLVDQNSPPPTDHKKSVAATAAPSAAAPLKGAVKNTSSPKAAAKAKDAATPKKKKAVVADDGLPALPAKKIDIPRFGKRKPAAGEADASGAESAPVSQNLIAIYNGDFREDDPAFSHIVRELGPIKARARSPQPGASGAMARTLPLVPWPNGSRPATHWFRDVPTFTPLPGTMGSRNFNLTAPVYNTNTSLLTLRHGRRYRDVLEQQTDFFTSTTASMHRGSAILRETAGGRTSPASAMNGTLGDTRGLVDRSDLPKRHAMTM